MGKFVKEFKEFVMRGNVLDLAVGVIIGGAFQSIVNSLCNDVILPGISWIVAIVSGMDVTNEKGELDFTKITGALNVGPLSLGKFAAAIINFLIMAVIIFMIVKAVNKMMDLNDSALFIINALKKKDMSFEELLVAMMDEYDVDMQTASVDLSAFIEMAKKSGVIVS